MLVESVAVIGAPGRDVAALVVATALLACGGAPRAPDAPNAAPSHAASPDVARHHASGPRWLVADTAAWIERTPDRVDRFVAAGARLEVKDGAILRAADDVALDAGAPLPSWAIAAATPAPRRYVFWKGAAVSSAASFLGELAPLGSLPGEVRRTFDWLDGVGLVTSRGPMLVRAQGEPVRLVVPAALDALAADGRRALVLTAFGHALATTDGGATFRDASDLLPGAIGLERRTGVLVGIDAGGRELPFGGPIRGEPKESAPVVSDDEPWRPSVAARVGSALAQAAILRDAAPRGGRDTEVEALAVVDAALARVDLRTGRATPLWMLPDGVGQCAPVRAADGVLVVCDGAERAVVIDVAGGPRIERTFDWAAGAPARDRFVGADGEALGFVGPCAGDEHGHALDETDRVDAVTAASPLESSTQQSRAFCVRVDRDTWVEHRLARDDAARVLAWVPRRGGGAVAIVARAEASGDRDRVEDRGALRVVRIGAQEPPLHLVSYSPPSPAVLSRALRATASGGVEGFLPGVGATGAAAITMDATGRIVLRPVPSRTEAIAYAGRFALASTDDGALYETTDYGASWREVAPPPGMPNAPSTCTEVGCRVGPFVRIGWSGPRGAAADAPAGAKGARLERRRAASGGSASGRAPHGRPRVASSLAAPVAPAARLACAALAPPEERRQPDSHAFGFTAAPAPRPPSPARILGLGLLAMPWSRGGLLPSGVVEVGWVPPLDLAAPVRRATLPLPSDLSAGGPSRLHEVRVGWLLAASGAVEPLAATSHAACPAALLDRAGVTRPLGSCAPDGALGVELDGRAVLLGAPHGASQLVIAIADLSRPRAGRSAPSGASPALGLGVRERARIRLAASSRGIAYGIGRRGEEAVAVAIDPSGAAVLSRIDEARGALGPEEPLAPLGSLRGSRDPACARGVSRGSEARVLVAFDTAIDLEPGALRGVVASAHARASAPFAGLAVVRWSAARACLDAIELAVRDERHEADVSAYDPPGSLRKIVARFDEAAPAPPASRKATKRDGRGSSARPGAGTLVLISPGAELRQRLACEVVSP